MREPTVLASMAGAHTDSGQLVFQVYGTQNPPRPKFPRLMPYGDDRGLKSSPTALHASLFRDVKDKMDSIHHHRMAKKWKIMLGILISFSLCIALIVVAASHWNLGATGVLYSIIFIVVLVIVMCFGAGADLRRSYSLIDKDIQLWLRMSLADLEHKYQYTIRYERQEPTLRNKNCGSVLRFVPLETEQSAS